MSPEGIDPQEAVYGDNYKPRAPKPAKLDSSRDEQYSLTLARKIAHCDNPNCQTCPANAALIDQYIQARDDYNTRVVDNINLAARTDVPAEYTDPVSGKKLYNEASVQAERTAARIDELETFKLYWWERRTATNDADYLKRRINRLKATLNPTERGKE